MMKRFMSWLLYQLQRLLNVVSGRRSPARSAASVPEKQATKRVDMELQKPGSANVRTDESDGVVSFSIQPEDDLAQPAIASSDDITDDITDTHMRLDAASSTVPDSALSNAEDPTDEQRSLSENIQDSDQFPSIHDLLPAVEQEIKESAAQYSEPIDLDSLKIEDNTAVDTEASEQAMLFSFDITESSDDVLSAESVAGGKPKALLKIDISDDKLPDEELPDEDLLDEDLSDEELPDIEELPATLEEDVDATGDDLVDADAVNADLADADLVNADLADADLVNADLADAGSDTIVDSTYDRAYSFEPDTGLLPDIELSPDTELSVLEDSDAAPIASDSTSADSTSADSTADTDSGESEASSEEPEIETSVSDTSVSTLKGASLPYPWSIAAPRSAANANEGTTVVKPNSEVPEHTPENIEVSTEPDSYTEKPAARVSNSEPMSTQQTQEHNLSTKNGVVKLLFTMKEGNFHGYIEPEDGSSDILFHQKYINEDIFESLERGVEVVVSIKYVEGKAYATRVELLT